MKEGEIQAAFRKFLDGQGRHFGIFYANPRADKKSTLREGWPDFTLIKGSHFLLIESKTAKGVLSEAQKELHAELRSKGIRVEVCRSVEDHVKTTFEWLSAVARDHSEIEAVKSLSATPTLPTQKDASTGIPEGKEGHVCRVWNPDTGKREVVPPIPPGHEVVAVAAYPDGKRELITRPVNGAANPGQAFLDKIEYASERIDDWQGQRWLTRQDKRGQWYFVRRATVNDLARLKSV